MGEWLNQRSAKPSTAVRIRFRPHQNSVRNTSNAVFLLVSKDDRITIDNLQGGQDIVISVDGRKVYYIEAKSI